MVRSSVLIAFFCLCGSLCGQPTDWLDSLHSRYSTAARDYDQAGLLQLEDVIRQGPAELQWQAPLLLLRGGIQYRLALIAWCNDRKAELRLHGEQAIAFLNQAEQAGVGADTTAAMRALVSQMLTGVDLSRARTYGPASAKELQRLRQLAPDSYFARLIEAINLNQAPVFVGGNPKKAAEKLRELVSAYPDSLDARIHLCDALRRSGRPQEAKDLLSGILKTHPRNLFAHKISRRLN